MKLVLRVRKSEFHVPGPPHWSGWIHDEKIVNYYVPGIQAVMAKSLDGIALAVRQARMSWSTIPIGKAPTSASQGQRQMANQVSAQAVTGNVSINAAQLEAIVRAIYGEAYLIGTHAAANLLGKSGGAVAFLSALDQEINWDTWEPGNPEAAIKAAQGGLAQLLTGAGVTIKNISGTTLDELGNKIAQGILNGESTQAIYQDVRAYVDNPVRATMIARTETARAVTAASFETYKQAGITEWIWMAAPNACPICLNNSIGGPYPMDNGPYMPAHPQCRCAAGAYIA